MQVCLSGTTVPQDASACQDAKNDGDSDVDQEDMGAFIRCLSGPGLPPDLDCAGWRPDGPKNLRTSTFAARWRAHRAALWVFWDLLFLPPTAGRLHGCLTPRILLAPRPPIPNRAWLCRLGCEKPNNKTEHGVATAKGTERGKSRALENKTSTQKRTSCNSHRMCRWRNRRRIHRSTLAHRHRGTCGRQRPGRLGNPDLQHPGQQHCLKAQASREVTGRRAGSTRYVRSNPVPVATTPAQPALSQTGVTRSDVRAAPSQRTCRPEPDTSRAHHPPPTYLAILGKPIAPSNNDGWSSYLVA